MPNSSVIARTGRTSAASEFSVAISDMFRSRPVISMRPSRTRCLSRAIWAAGRPLEVFAHGPGGLAGPAEAGVIGQAVGQVAVIEGVINVAQVLGENLRLGPGVADVGVGVLGQIHRPLARRLKGEWPEDLPLARHFDLRRHRERDANGRNVVRTTLLTGDIAFI